MKNKKNDNITNIPRKSSSSTLQTANSEKISSKIKVDTKISKDEKASLKIETEISQYNIVNDDEDNDSINLDDNFYADYDINRVNFNTLPWIEKYRPSTIDDVLSHDNIRQSLKKFIENRYFPHLLFYGPPGSGKTSTIMACVRELYGNSLPFMVKELNASDDRGIDVVRTVIKQFVMAKNVFYDNEDVERKNIFKMIILDETDAMTRDAQAILRKIVEKYNLTTRFCFICNNVQNIDPALQSRCTRFRFAPLDKKNIVVKISEIASLEKIKVTDSGVSTIINRSNGDMRKIINILQSTSMAYSVINETNVNKILGYPSRLIVGSIINSILTMNFEDAYNFVLQTKRTNALSVSDILEEIQGVLNGYLLGNKTTLKNDIEPKCVTRILDKLRLIENNLAYNTLETIQIASLVGIIHYYSKIGI